MGWRFADGMCHRLQRRGPTAHGHRFAQRASVLNVHLSAPHLHFVHRDHAVLKPAGPRPLRDDLCPLGHAAPQHQRRALALVEPQRRALAHQVVQQQHLHLAGEPPCGQSRGQGEGGWNAM